MNHRQYNRIGINKLHAFTVEVADLKKTRNNCKKELK